MDAPTTLDAVEIMKIIPHRYPFLLVDRIEEIEAGKRAVGVKNVTMGDPFFQGHFPDYPVMPGVLIVEALAQVGAVAMLVMDEYKGKIAFFAGIDNVRFKRQVKPGDTLLGMNLTHGGHLTHGSPVNFSGQLYRAIAYGVREDNGLIDYDASLDEILSGRGTTSLTFLMGLA